MSKKGKGKEKGNKKGSKKGKEEKREEPTFEDKEKLLEVDRAFYELAIEDAKKKILTLRNHIKNLKESNNNIDEELRALTVGKVNRSAKLEKEINEIEENIIQLRNENAILTDEYNEEKRKADEIISDLELKTKTMNHQLSADVKRLKGRLNACEELHNNWDNWMLKYSNRLDGIAAKEKEAQQTLRNLEANIFTENGILKENLLKKIMLAAEEFSTNNSTTSSELNMRLIRENCALEKCIDLLTKSNAEMNWEMLKELETYKRNKAKIPILNNRNKKLILESQQTLNRISKLSAEVERLKKKFIPMLSYREEYIKYRKFQMCAHFHRKKLIEAATAAGHQVRLISREKNVYDYMIEQYKTETLKISEYLGNVRGTIERSLLLKEPQPINSDTPREVIQRCRCEVNNVLVVLVDLLQTEFDVLVPGQDASIESVSGYEKLVQFDHFFRKEASWLSSYMDLYLTNINSKEEEKGTSSSETMDVDRYRHDLYETQITPGQRPLGENYIFDIEKGTSLYFSSSREASEVGVAEEHVSVGEEEQTSSDDYSGPVQKSKKPEKEFEDEGPKSEQSSAEKPLIEMPPGTIIDVVSEEEPEEEELAIGEYVEEDGAYDINLFY